MIKGSTGLVSLEASLLVSQTAISSLYPQMMAFPLWELILAVPSSSYEDTSHGGMATS